jgi:hypothetical protein
MGLLEPVRSLRRRRYRKGPVTRIDVQEGVHIDTCWKEHQIGCGPHAKVYVAGIEVFRFDCFQGKGLGHWHVYPPVEAVADEDELGRIFFLAEAVEDQVDLAVLELRDHFQGRVSAGPNEPVRRVRLDPEQVARACDAMRAAMLGAIPVGHRR